MVYFIILIDRLNKIIIYSIIILIILCLLQNCKAYAKRSIQYIPSLGWSWKFAEFVFLERSYDKDKEFIGKQISEIMDYPDPTWVSI